MTLFTYWTSGLPPSRDPTGAELPDLRPAPLQRPRPRNVPQGSGLGRGHPPQVSPGAGGQLQVSEPGPGERLQPQQADHPLFVLRH